MIDGASKFPTPDCLVPPQPSGSHPSTNLLSRRSFVKLGSYALAALTVGGTSTILYGCESPAEFLSGKRTITDDIGRTVTIPTVSKLTSIYFTSPLAQIFCFTLAPDLLAGTTIPFNNNQLAYLPENTRKLDFMGSLSGGGFIDTEVLRYNNVQLIFSISGTDLTDVNINDALALQDQTGIPVVLIDGSFDRIGKSYQLLGELLGRRERAEELASYCQDIYDRVTTAVAKIPEDELVTYYFAEGQEGLQTEPNASEHSLAFQVARGINVAGTINPDEPGRSAGVADNHDMVNVSLNEIRAWDPEFIIAWDFTTRNGADQIIRNYSAWSDISAVKTGRVYTMPNIPFSFCDRPPGVNRFLGIQWLANLLYPTYYDVDMIEVVRDFYSTCYWRDISKDQARSILGL